MLGFLRDLLLVISTVAALVGFAWVADPAEHYLHTGRTCQEIREHLVAKQFRGLTPAEETDMANCN
jgi:hypothetical protein